MQKIRIFIDANVWYAAANKSTGHARQLLSGIFKNIEIVTSNLALEEVTVHLSKNAPNRIYVLESLIDGLGDKLTVLSAPNERLVAEYLKQVLDSEDAPILASAKEAKADFLVTWNTKDFIQEKIFDIKIVTPVELVKKVT